MGSNDYQTLVDNIAHDKYGYIEIQGHEGRDPEKLLNIYAYESKNSLVKFEYYHLQEKYRESVKKVAEQHSIVFEELPDREIKTKVQKEFERWFERIVEKGIDEISHYEKAVEFAKELSHGVVRGYWKNEIVNINDIFDLTQNAGWQRDEFNVGRDRLAIYMIKRIGYGSRTGQSFISKRGAHHYHGNDEASDMDLMISTMVGIGLLKKVDVSNIYELTSEAFALLKKPKWYERHAEILSWASIVFGIFSTVAVILSSILALRELGIV